MPDTFSHSDITTDTQTHKTHYNSGEESQRPDYARAQQLPMALVVSLRPGAPQRDDTLGGLRRDPARGAASPSRLLLASQAARVAPCACLCPSHDVAHAAEKADGRRHFWGKLRCMHGNWIMEGKSTPTHKDVLMRSTGLQNQPRLSDAK